MLRVCNAPSSARRGAWVLAGRWPTRERLSMATLPERPDDPSDRGPGPRDLDAAAPRAEPARFRARVPRPHPRARPAATPTRSASTATTWPPRGTTRRALQVDRRLVRLLPERADPLVQPGVQLRRPGDDRAGLRGPPARPGARLSPPRPRPPRPRPEVPPPRPAIRPAPPPVLRGIRLLSRPRVPASPPSHSRSRPPCDYHNWDDVQEATAERPGALGRPGARRPDPRHRPGRPGRGDRRRGDDPLPRDPPLPPLDGREPSRAGSSAARWPARRSSRWRAGSTCTKGTRPRR